MAAADLIRHVIVITIAVKTASSTEDSRTTSTATEGDLSARSMKTDKYNGNVAHSLTTFNDVTHI